MAHAFLRFRVTSLIDHDTDILAGSNNNLVISDTIKPVVGKIGHLHTDISAQRINKT
jgi:hypothetical protein